MRTGDEWVQRLGALIEGHLRLVGKLSTLGEPGVASQARAEQETSESGPEGPWGTLPAYTTLSGARLKLIAASDHLESLRRLLRVPLTLYGLMVIARAVVEASSQAYWLLDPAISVRERVARHFADRRYSAAEARRAVALLNPSFADPGLVRKIEGEAAELGIEMSRMPSNSDLAEAVLSPHTTGPEAARGLYKFMCANAHATTYAMVQHLRPVGPPDIRSQKVEPYMPLEAVVWAVTASLDAHASAFERLLVYIDADRWAWERWSDKVRRDVWEAMTATKFLRGVGGDGK